MRKGWIIIRRKVIKSIFYEGSFGCYGIGSPASDPHYYLQLSCGHTARSHKTNKDAPKTAICNKCSHLTKKDNSQ